MIVPASREKAAGNRTADHYCEAMVEQAAAAIFSVDPEGRVATWNAAAERLFGYPAGSCRGRRLGFLEVAEATDPPPQGIRQAVATALGQPGPVEVELACRRADGARVLVTTCLAPIRDPAEHLLGVSVVARDVSARHQLEADLRASNRQKTEFFTVMAHELRTPLTAVRGYTDMLLRGLAGPLPARVAEYLEHVRGASGRMLDLADVLLDYARIESGTEQLQLEPVELAAVVARAVADVRPRADARGLALSVDVPALEGARRVWADAEKLQQALGNYLDNAVKFTPAGGSIRVAVHGGDDGFARVSVADTGIGLSREQLPRVWDRFYQADASLTRPYGGLGLGLSIVRHLVALHGGRAWAESRGLGEGSTFWLTLRHADR